MRGIEITKRGQGGLSMAGRRNFKLSKGNRAGNWRLVNRIGGGGNGDVWKCERDNEPQVAIKFLKRMSDVALARFKAETTALELAGKVAGIIPMIEQGDAMLSGRKVPWFSMPLAKPFNSRIERRSSAEIVREFLLLADTLAELHDLKIYHRDIKPANILALDDRLCFSDFGLVKFPARGDLTPPKEPVGPKFTMAPEMRRKAAEAAGGPADVFSFAKTLWIALTGEKMGFDGQYSPSGYLALSRYCKDEYLTPLDELLSECTDTDPEVRPTIRLVHARLLEWVEMMEDFDRRNLSEWTVIQNRLFPNGAPISATWTDINSICSVLRQAGQTQSLNHMFFPDGGGMSLTGVARSHNPELIELRTGFLTIVKPAKLTFESFAAGTQWNYFRLEAATLEPTGVEGAYLHQDGYAEEVWELSPGRFAGIKPWEDGEFTNDPDADNARRLHRVLKGCFVIFSTASPYNRTPETYDARHEKMNEEQFRAYMQRSADHSLK